jgi:hypothetical protein
LRILIPMISVFAWFYWRRKSSRAI